MDPITWMIIGFLLGGVVAVFWDDIKEWASRVVDEILNIIDSLIEVTSDAITYLLKQGTRVYRRVEVYVRNVRTGGTKLEYRQEEISIDDIPEDLKNQLNERMKIKILQQVT